MGLETSASILSMIFGAGPVVKFVLITLVFLSVLCWTVIFAKVIRFRQAKRANKVFEELFWESSNLNEVYAHARRMSGAPMAGVFLAGHTELKRLQECSTFQDPVVGLRVWLETLERSLNKGIQKEMAALEWSLHSLATTGNAAPFIGLFGTVWGIMGSFHSIGLKGSASLATVAPGISEALVATAAGLAAAIPAVIAFNGFMGWMAGQDVQLQGFAGDFLNTVERQLFQEEEAGTGEER